MSANFPGRHRLAVGQEPTWQGDGAAAPPWHTGTAMAVSFTVVVVGLAGLGRPTWVLLGVAGFRRHGAPSIHDAVTGYLDLSPVGRL